ncbi:MAG: helix-hairpin-helix domain-containing protein [Bacteroidales bacterium]|nr:helix-hairpin-helix domain-containing protein [Bacteroidales bacterium]
MKNFRLYRAEQLSLLTLILGVLLIKFLTFRIWSREERRPDSEEPPAALTEPIEKSPRGTLPGGTLSEDVLQEQSYEAGVLPAGQTRVSEKGKTGYFGPSVQPAPAERPVRNGRPAPAASDGRPVRNFRPTRIDLNRADSTALVAVKGIGPYTASRILRYRRQLGGFVSLEQLDEIRGLRPENLEQLKLLADIDTTAVSRLSLNGATVETLASHPYLSWRQARALVGLRKKRGGLHSADELGFLDDFTSADLVRLAPYLRR